MPVDPYPGPYDNRAEPDYSDIGAPVSGPFILDDLPGGDPAYPKERSHEEASRDQTRGGDHMINLNAWIEREFVTFNLLLIYSVAVTLALLFCVT